MNGSDAVVTSVADAPLGTPPSGDRRTRRGLVSTLYGMRHGSRLEGTSQESLLICRGNQELPLGREGELAQQSHLREILDEDAARQPRAFVLRGVFGRSTDLG